jgi:hypothetical protein
MSKMPIDDCRVAEIFTMTRRAATLFTLVVLAVAASSTWAQETVRVRGTIVSVEGQTLMVRSRDGSDLKIVLADDAPIVSVVKASLSDIGPGSYVGAAGVPQANGSQKALEVHIFPEAMRGTGEGHSVWDLQAGSTMTNAQVVNVEQTVVAVEGRTLTLKYKNGEQRVVVAPDAAVVAYVMSSSSELQPGAKIFILAAKKLPDGTLQAPRVNVGRDGLTPPM